MLVGIFENKKNGNYWWEDWLEDEAMKQAKYFVDNDYYVGVHVCIKSALHDDMTGYVDMLQNERNLADDELYVVCYDYMDDDCSLWQCVDFGITKQEIIENVKSQKYIEGANYYTIGQMFYTTKEVMEGKYND